MRAQILTQLRGLKDPQQIADALHRVVRDAATAAGMNPDIEVFLRKEDGGWRISWEAGPYQWAYNASFAVMDAVGRLCEPYYSFDLCLYEAE